MYHTIYSSDNTPFYRQWTETIHW